MKKRITIAAPPAPKPAGEILTAQQLSERWGGHPTPMTLAKWREAGEGPKWFKVGGKTSRALYDLADVVAYETKKKAEAGR